LADKDAGRPKRGKLETRRAWARENEHRRRDVKSVCAHCGDEFLGRRGEKNRFCTTACTRASRRVPRPLFRQLEFYFPPPMGRLRQAYECGWTSIVVTMLLASTELTDSGCAIWTRQVDRDRYPRVSLGQKRLPVHRLMAEMLHGDLDHMPVHHKCGNRQCIQPSHLQVVTPAENTAEMLERRRYQARIAELEAQLAGLTTAGESRRAS
jgi:hypothetical protein